MKRIVLVVLAALMTTVAFAGAKIEIKGVESKNLVVYSATIADFFKVKSKTDSLLAVAALAPIDGVFYLEFPDGPARRYIVEPTEDEREYFEFYAEENDQLSIVATYTDSGFEVVATGNRVMEDLNRMNAAAKPLRDKFEAIPRVEQNREQLEKAYGDWLESFGKFAAENPSSLASVLAVSYIDDPEEAKNIAESLAPEVKESFMKPMLDKTMESIEKKLVIKKIKENVAEGKQAPNFSLPNEEGKLVTLAQFLGKGKWILLDFWGTWCPWCIKGIPQMKENYKKYSKKLEIISIACNEKGKDVWLAGLKEHNMPWVQVYSDGQTTEMLDLVQTQYAVEGYPTKYLIDSKGKIVKICVGEDPKFYDDFAKLLK